MSEEKKPEYIAENADAEADTIFGGSSAPAPEPVTRKKRSSKNTQMLIAGICVLVLLSSGLAASFYLLGLHQNPEDAESIADSTETEAISLNAMNADDVVSVEITNVDTFTVTRLSEATEEESAVYTIDGYEDITLDTALLSTLVKNGSKLEAASLAEENVFGQIRYGLSDPAAEVTMHYADGSEFTFTIGDIVPMNASNVYCEVDGNVYLVRNSLMANYQKEAVQFISTTVLEAPAKTPIVKSLRIERDDLDYDMYMEYDYEGAEDTSVGGVAATHILLEPVFSYLSLDRATDTVSGMFGLHATEIAVVHPEEADWKKTGLEESFCSVTMECEDGNIYHLWLGDTYETADGTACYYARFEDTPLIYGISTAKAVWGTVLPKDITSANVFTTYVWDVGTLEITAGSQKLTFEGEGIEQKDYIVTKNGEECSTERFRKLFAFILSIYGEELYLGELPSGKPDAQIHLVSQDKKENYTVSFYKQSDMKTILSRDGTNYSIRTSCLDTLLYNLEIFDDTDTDFKTTWQ